MRPPCFQHLLLKIVIGQKQCKPFLSAIGIVLALILGYSRSTVAQVTADGTLSTTVTTSDNLNFLIEGGEECCTQTSQRMGNNLFHSFDAFSIPTNGSAIFNNTSNIETIFSRVTGNNISNIDGRIQANGTASLFLINPNGIVFGPTASLDIGGSFLATTADRVLFENDRVFSTTDTAMPPLLTLSVPTGLEFSTRSGDIMVQGEGHSLALDFPALNQDQRPVGLQVESGQTFALIGGDIRFEGGNITAEQGRIELGSVDQSGVISLSSTGGGLAFEYDVIDRFGTIQLDQSSSIDTSGEGSGTIHIQSGTFDVIEGSAIINNVLGDDDGGSITIQASEAVNILGPETGDFPTILQNNTDVNSTGAAGNLRIETDALRLANDAFILSSTSGTGVGGDMAIVADDILLSGPTPQSIRTDVIEALGIFKILTSVSESGKGQGGNLNIKAQQLSLQNGILIGSVTFGEGDAGNLTIEATTVDVVGLFSKEEVGILPSFISTDTFSSGQGGTLTLQTDRLSVREGGQISAGTFAEGNGGNLIIDAQTVEVTGSSLIESDPPFPVFSGLLVDTTSSGNGGNLWMETARLAVTDGAAIFAGSSSTGNAGNIIIRASEQIDISGLDSRTQDSSFIASDTEDGNSMGNGGNIILETAYLRVLGGSISTQTLGTGNAGNIEIRAEKVDILSAIIDGDDSLGSSNRLIIENDTAIEGFISVSGLGSGNAGNLRINADMLQLENGALRAEANVGTQGNISLTINDLLVLRQRSSITATATAQSTGGNINIRTPFIVGIPGNNSDIVANAVQGDGGNIIISTEGLLGFALRDRLTSDNDITASSESGFDGIVTITPLNVNLAADVAVLPTTIVDETQQITTTCNSVADNRFTLTGRGGLPLGPYGNEGSERPWPQILPDFGSIPAQIVDLSLQLPVQSANNSSRNRTAGVNIEPNQPMRLPGLTEATGMAIAPNGTLQLVASHAQSPIPFHPTCTSDSNIS